MPIREKGIYLPVPFRFLIIFLIGFSLIILLFNQTLDKSYNLFDKKIEETLKSIALNTENQLKKYPLSIIKLRQAYEKINQASFIDKPVLRLKYEETKALKKLYKTLKQIQDDYDIIPYLIVYNPNISSNFDYLIDPGVVTAEETEIYPHKQVGERINRLGYHLKAAEPFPKMLAAWQTGQAYTEDWLYDPELKQYSMSIYRPIVINGQVIALLGIDYLNAQKKEELLPLKKSVNHKTVLIIVIMVLIQILIIRAIRERLKPMQTLISWMKNADYIMVNADGKPVLRTVENKKDFGVFRDEFFSLIDLMLIAFSRLAASHVTGMSEMHKELADNLLRGMPLDEALKSKLKNLIMLFCDISGFTEYSEKLTPEQTALYVNAFCYLMEETLAEHNMIKVDFNGDEIISFDELSDDEKLTKIIGSLKTALAMGEAMKKLPKLCEDRGLKNVPDLALKIGLHTGPSTIGFFGHRYKIFTIISKHMNLAARVMGQARLKSKIIIAEIETEKDISCVLISKPLKEMLPQETLAKNNLQITEFGERILKGIGKTILYRVTAK